MLDAILFYGQSNAGGGGNAEPVLVEPVHPDRMFTFDGAWQIYATSTVDPARLKGLGSVKDKPKHPPFPATAMAYALGRDEPHRKYFMQTVWYGGQPLTKFVRGTDAWRNLMNVAVRMGDSLAEKDMRGRVRALVVVQGEAGPPGRDVYSQLLRTFLDETIADIKTAAKQADPPIAIVLQTNESNVQGRTAKDVALAQWDVVRSRTDGTVLAGPMYQLPLIDSVHQSAEGRMMIGDLLAHVFRVVDRGDAFEPLHPTSAKIGGKSVVIVFKRPHASLPLTFDESWVPHSPNFGFELFGDQCPVEIAETTITGPSEVTLRFTQERDEPITVRYAMAKSPADGWTSSRGQLMAPTMERSAFAHLKVKVPEFIAHYAIRFEMRIER